MADYNRVNLIGRLTADPDLRRTPNGTAVAELRMAVNRSYQGKDGERRKDVAYIDVTVWDKTAENCCQYLQRGSSIHVDGSLRTDEWTDKTTGEKRSKLKVNGESVQFLDSKPRDERSDAPRREPERADAPRREPERRAAPRPNPLPNVAPTGAPGYEEDSDIPF